MHELIKEWLVEQQIISDKTEVTLNARLCGNWAILCFVLGELHYFIKLGTTSSIDNEFNAITLWHQRLPEQILKPIRKVTIGSFDGYLQTATTHKTLNKFMFLSSDLIKQQMLRYFEMNAQYCENQAYDLPSNVINFGNNFSMSASLQHGDFTLTNIGIFKNEVLFFDWEDYGEASFPLMDLITFLMSLFDFKLNDFAAQLKKDIAFKTWLEAALAYYKVSLSQFIELIPCGLLSFLELKQRKGYGQDIIQKTKKALETCQSDWSS